jgi:glycosyltransferase involved in cell wall biosynthesis
MIDKSLNILIVASWYPSEHSPTEGSFIEEQADLLISKGHNVLVLHPYLIGRYKDSIGKKKVIQFTVNNGKKILSVGVPAIIPGYRGLTYWYCFQCSLNAMKKYFLNLYDFDIVHSHAIFMAGCIGFWISKKFKIPQIHTEHASGLIFNPSQYSKFDHRIIERVYNNSKHVLFVSDFARFETCKILNLKNMDKFEVIPNLVSNRFFESNFKEIPLPLKFLNIGNFIPVKNHRLLFRAWGQLQRIYPDAKLTLIGEGPLLDEMKKLVQSDEINNVTFIPRQRRNAILNQIEKHHIIISSSIVETFGLTIAEAQAMGKPVVVTDSGGVRDIVDPKTGIITSQSVQSFFRGLIKIQTNFLEFHPIEIRRITNEKFSEEIIYLKLIKIYKSVLNRYLND